MSRNPCYGVLKSLEHHGNSKAGRGRVTGATGRVGSGSLVQPRDTLWSTRKKSNGIPATSKGTLKDCGQPLLVLGHQLQQAGPALLRVCQQE